MKKFIVFTMFLLITMQVQAYTPDDYVRGRTFFGSGNKNLDPMYLHMQDAANGFGQRGTASVFYVDSNVSNEGDGTSWTRAKDTLDEAIGLCEADRGDIIYVAQGHKEVEATAATSLFTLDVAGVSIIGISSGGYEATVASGVITLNQRPTFVVDAADATITVSAKSCRISGLLFVSDIDNVAVGVTVAATADGFTMDKCVFRDNGAALDMLVMLSIAAGTQNVNLVDNLFLTTAAAGGNNAILLAGANTNLVVNGNRAYGKFATGVLLGSAAAQVNATIEYNTFLNAEAAIAIAVHTSSTGVCSNNYLGGTTSIAAAWTGNDAMWCFENQVSGTAGARGIPDPAADAD